MGKDSEMSGDVKSNNQSGGITAFNVNISDSSQIADQGANTAKPKRKGKLAKFALVVSIVASVIAVLLYFGIKPGGNKMSENKKNINVTSYNQSGGITAYNVNIGPQDRKLTSQLADQLLDHIKKNSIEKATVTSVMGDQEAFQFASAIKAFLTDQGIPVNGVNQAVYNKPIKGQIIEPVKDDSKSINIIIGGK